MHLFIVLLLPTWILAIPLDTLINNAKNNHTSLKSIEQRVSAIDHEYEISRNFTDPLVSITVSDIQLDDISNRSIEPMQYTAINFSQKIPYFGKRDALGDKITAKKERVNLSIDAMQVKIVREIKIIAYKIWQREEVLKITDEYIKLTRKNIDLYSSYTSTDSKSHMSIMSAEMSLSELKIKKNRLKSSLKGLYEKISYLSEMKVSSVDMDTKLFKPQPLKTYTKVISRNITSKIKQASLKEANLNIKVKELDSYIDPVLTLGYFQRQSYEDYVNIGVAFKVPLYGTQDSTTQISRKIALASQSELIDFDNKLLAEVSNIHAKLESSYTIHTIIMDESMPQIEHMFELSSSSIKSGDELFLYINLLEKKLALDEKNILVVASYHTNQAILDSLIGVSQ